jgi:hypothetical protein
VHGNCKCASVVAQFGISADFDFDGVILSAAVFQAERRISRAAAQACVFTPREIPRPAELRRASG